MQDIVREWVSLTIQSDPKRYGGDYGATEIIHTYLNQKHPDCFIDKQAVAVVTSIDRFRRDILDKMPELDRRTQSTKNNGGHTGRQTVIYDFVDKIERQSMQVSDDCLKLIRDAANEIG